jgi:hypothetical protein
MAQSDWGERVNRDSGTSTGRAGFSLSGGRAEMKWTVPYNDLSTFLTQALGSAKAGSDGRIVRTLPRTHPQYPWLVCTACTNILGVGIPSDGGQQAAVAQLEAPSLYAFQRFTRYEITLEFNQVPYSILSNDRISTARVTWYDTDGSTVDSRYATEYDRYCDWEYEPGAEYITAQQGQMVFNVNGGAAPDGYAFAGQPRLLLNQSLIRFRWMMVPWSFVTSANSWITNRVAHVNQLQFMTWPAGSLLYVGAAIKRYTPIFPSVVATTGDTVSFSLDKLCDIEFRFLYTKRTRAADPATLTNNNWVAQGHNLQPWYGDNGYYMAQTLKAGVKGPPTYPSFPFQLLLTNPDLEG